MNKSPSTDNANQQSDNARTEAERKAGTSSGAQQHADDSSGNNKSHAKAGSEKGAGGGAKQERKH